MCIAFAHCGGMSQSSTDTVLGDPKLRLVDFSSLPPVYVLATHLSVTDQTYAEDVLSNGGAPLTYDIQEAGVVLGNLSTSRRAKLELQWKGLDLIEDDAETSSESEGSTQARKRRKFRSSGHSNHSASGTEDDAPASHSLSQLSLSQMSTANHFGHCSPQNCHEKVWRPSGPLEGRVTVAKLEWLHQSLKANQCLPLKPFLLYRAKKRAKPQAKADAHAPADTIGQRSNPVAISELMSEPVPKPSATQGIIDRAKEDETAAKKGFRRKDRVEVAAGKDAVGRSVSSSTQTVGMFSERAGRRRLPQLLHQTTSEHDEGSEVALPPMPEWVLQNKLYSCERATPLDSPNSDFIAQLKQIKLARVLTTDEIGVRAYSTSIASLAAYPYRLQSDREILALPGCDQKIAHLFQEYQSTGQIQAILDIQDDPALKVLRVFYEIWGVGAVTARDFYYDKGWRELDDIVEFGWRSLSRVQQIGVKYYDEFQRKIPRAEVEFIAAIITKHARRVTDSNLQSIIVGGYRRGKPESGDVDMILSHPEHQMTLELVSRVVKSLEAEGWVTHTLTLNVTNSKRNQETLPINTSSTGHGFDTLDKALVVWQDPRWPKNSPDLSNESKPKNPNPHRRVDIIISPWRTVGCAVTGWTSGTTFQRDLRRYAKKVKGWKFDSSGVRDRVSGQWMDLEGWRNERTRCTDWKEAERRVFEGLGLVYREPWDRCTG